MTKRVTVLDVAERAGVSHTSVSMALRGSPRVSEEKRRRILNIVREMNYQPSAAAQLLRANRTRQVGVIVAAHSRSVLFDHDFAGPLVGHIIERCARHDLRYAIEAHHHDAEGVPHQIGSGLVDGSLLVGDVGDDLRQRLSDMKTYPWVSIGEPGEFCVLADARAGAYEATARLARLGHRRIAYGGGPRRYAIHNDAVYGFRQAVADHQLEVREDDGWVREFRGELTAELAGENLAWARALLRQHNRPTAFFCHGETIARGVIHAATELGLTTPADLSVIGWGSPWLAERIYPRLTVVANDFAAMAEQALVLLQQQIEGSRPAQTAWHVTPMLIEGATLGPAPQGLIPNEVISTFPHAPASAGGRVS
jgi:LacI family transcriptional regulator